MLALQRGPVRGQGNYSFRFACQGGKEAEEVARRLFQQSPWLKRFDFRAKFFLRPAEPFLEASEKFIIFSFCEHQVIVGQLSVLLFQLTFRFIPAAFEL